MGNRFAGGIMPGAMPSLHRYLGNPVLSWVARRSFGVPIRDFHCGMRAFTRQAFDKMMLQTPGMEFATEMVANAAHQGLRIGEIPIVLHPDKRGRPPHLRSFRDGWRHLRFILTYAPDYTFLAPGILMLLAGLVLQAVLVMGPVTIGGLYLGIHFLALGCLLALAGFNIFNLGVFAKTLLAQRYDGFRSRTARWVEQRFSLDAGIMAGGLLLLAGTIVDGVYSLSLAIAARRAHGQHRSPRVRGDLDDCARHQHHRQQPVAEPDRLAWPVRRMSRRWNVGQPRTGHCGRHPLLPCTRRRDRTRCCTTRRRVSRVRAHSEVVCKRDRCTTSGEAGPEHACRPREQHRRANHPAPVSTLDADGDPDALASDRPGARGACP